MGCRHGGGGMRRSPAPAFGPAGTSYQHRHVRRRVNYRIADHSQPVFVPILQWPQRVNVNEAARATDADTTVDSCRESKLLVGIDAALLIELQHHRSLRINVDFDGSTAKTGLRCASPAKRP